MSYTITYIQPHDCDLRRTIVLPPGRGLADVKDGFWVDAAGQWCGSMQCRHYILPHMVTRITVNRDEEPSRVFSLDQLRGLLAEYEHVRRADGIDEYEIKYFLEWLAK